MLGSPGWSVLLAMGIAFAAAGAEIASTREVAGIFGLVILLPPILVMLAALIYQLLKQKWLKALCSLALGIAICYPLLNSPQKRY